MIYLTIQGMRCMNDFLQFNKYLIKLKLIFEFLCIFNYDRDLL